MQTPRTEFAQALRAIATERGLDPDVIIDAVKQAIIAAYKRDAKDKGEDVDTFGFDVDINPANGEARVFSWPVEIDEFSTRVGGLISGMILRFEGPDIRVDLGRTEGIMPSNDRISSERLNPNQRLTFLLKDIIETLRGKQIILSRADPNFVQKLFEREVPEIASKSVIINAIAREAGVRTKIAVSSNQSGVDPVGSCVGQKGVRVQAVTNELGGERVDIIPFSENMADLIAASLSPAEGLTVKLDKDKKTAKV